MSSIAVGGAAVGRDDDGRVVFVDGALPGERVQVDITDQHARHARGRCVAVLEPSPSRMRPPCPYVAAGCGGCGWQHVAHAAQVELKAEMVRDALERLGKLADPAVVAGPPLAATGYRTTVRLAIAEDGWAGFRSSRSHTVVPVETCLVAHPLVDEVIGAAVWGDADEAVIRVGARTGERLVVASPTAAGVEVPEGVRLVGSDSLAAGRRAWIHEEVAGTRLRVSARSFFQARPDGAEALIDAVEAIVAPVLADGGGVAGLPLLDLYAGVGLFAATVGRAASRVVAVEWSPSAVADAKVNLAPAGPAATVVRSDVTRFRPRPAAAVIADPSRAGLGRAAVRVIAATEAPVVALVSCDAGALGRDAGLLERAGYRFEGATVVDLFPHTPHVEVVSAFRRVTPVAGKRG